MHHLLFIFIISVMVSFGAYLKLYKFHGHSVKQTIFYAVIMSIVFVLGYFIDLFLLMINIHVHFVVIFICFIVPCVVTAAWFESYFIKE